MGWPDVIILAVVAVAALKGFKRGLIMELSGAIALLLGFVTPWFYNGSFDGFLENALRLGSAAAHVAAMIAVGVATYVGVLLLARVLSRLARLPILGTGNALAGAIVGALKGAILVWVVLYVALFFPLPPEVRMDLRHSRIVGYVTLPNAAVDRRVSASLPWFARPFVHPMFERHRV